MKKILIASCAVLLFASAAFAGTSVDMSISGTSPKTGLTLYGAKADADATSATPTAGQKLIGKTSTGVGLGIITSTAGYALYTQHKSGIKAYGSSHDSTAVYMKDVSAGTEVGTHPSAIGSTDFVGSSSGWTTM